ncbi:MAG: phosphopantothenate/pantothenate synthetase family protein, partial [Candidatus Hodarchaeales archaeon]
EAGAEKLLGIDPKKQTTIEEISHQRRIVDIDGIAISDCIFVPLEDGDRTQALKHLQKEVITVDLNPLSRTSLTASVSITNNITRAVNEMVDIAKELKQLSREELLIERSKLNNRKLLETALKFMSNRLMKLATEF